MKKETFNKIVSAALATVTIFSGSMVNAVTVQAVSDTGITNESSQIAPLENLSEIESEFIPLSGQVVMNGSATGGSGGYTYAYYYKKADAQNWAVQNYSNATSASFKPNAATTYNVCIRVKDSNGKVAEKRFDVEVKDTLENTSTVESESVIFGSEVVMNGSATGGSGNYTYAYYYKKADAQNWAVQNYSNATSASFKPNAATTYNICIRVKDSNGKVAEKRFDVEVKDTLENTSTVESESVVFGSEVVMNGSATGGSGNYTYAYYYKKADAQNWAVQNYSNATSASFKPNTATTYNICIRVKDSNGKVAEKRFDVEVKDTLENTSTVESESVIFGSEVVMNGSATGGSGNYTYAYYYKKADAQNWAVQNYSNATSASFKPNAATTYNICIRVKDSNGKVAEKRFDVEVRNTLENISSVESESIVLGNNIVMNGAVNGGWGNYSYAYLYRRSGDEKWVLAKNYSSETTYSFQPLKETTYEVCIKVKDSTNTVIAKTFQVEVKNTLKNTSSVESETVAINDQIKINGSATGGSGDYMYAYYYKKSSASQWTKLTDYISDSTVAFEPMAVTTYDICIKVKDSNGIKAEDKKYSVTVYSTLTNDSYIESEQLSKGQEAVVHGVANGGKGGYQYAYLYKRADTAWSKEQYSSDTEFRFQPTKETTYEICIKVKDAANTVIKKYFTITVGAPLVNVSSVNNYNVQKGGTLVIKTTASGGSGQYEYKYMYKNMDSEQWKTIQDFSYKSSANVKLSYEGSYDVWAIVRDSNGAEVGRYFEIHVKALTNTSKIVNAKDGSKLTLKQVDRGTTVSLRASAKGGWGNYRFAFQYRNPNSSTWNVLKDYSAINNTKLKLEELGNYIVRIFVKDSQGEVKFKDFTIHVVKSEAEIFTENVIPKIIRSSMSDFDKAKAIHDWIINYADYDIENYNNDSIPETSNTAEGLYQTGKAVCGGYARAFTLLASNAGLEVKTIFGKGVGHAGAEPEAHAWNQVKIDGQWYNVDVTWDDPIVTIDTNESNLSYQYFLVPDSVFYANHTPDKSPKPVVCTASQPWDKIEPAIIENVKNEEETGNNIYFCETGKDISQAYSKSIANKTDRFTIIYKTTETNYTQITATIRSNAPSNVRSSISVGKWKYDGYYTVNIIILK